MTSLADLGDDAILIAGGGRAILLQLAHPAIGHAIAEHSTFATDPMRRLRSTLTYVYATVYGSEAQRVAVSRFVDRSHSRVSGAADAELQRWVTATLYDTAVRVHELVHGPLDAASRERILADYAVVGTALGMPASVWPRTVAEFEVVWSHSLAALEVDDVTRGVARQLLHPTGVPLWLRAAMPLGRLVTGGLLDARLRAEFGIDWSEARARRFARVVRVASLVWPRVPRRLRSLPMRRLLARLDA